MISVKEVEKAIGEKAQRWRGNCYHVAVQVVRARLVKGRPTYGHWLGPISDKSIFAAARKSGFCRHGWIETPFGIVDPTRWVFEAAKPYIYCGPSDYYDKGGNLLRKSYRKPCPPFDPKGERFPLPKGEFRRIMSFFPPGTKRLNAQMAFWLANSPRQDLGADARLVYRWLIGLGRDGWIPIDNRIDVLQLPIPLDEDDSDLIVKNADIPPKCFRCDGTGEICNVCGESLMVCGCFEHEPCPCPECDPECKEA